MSRGADARHYRARSLLDTATGAHLFCPAHRGSFFLPSGEHLRRCKVCAAMLRPPLDRRGLGS